MLRNLILLVVFLFSCQPSNIIFIEHQELSPRLQWLKNDVKKFKVPLEDVSVAYDLYLAFRYVNGFEHDAVKVKLTEIHPSGEEMVKQYELRVKDEKGDFIGEFAYEIWDSEHLVMEKRTFPESGTYTYLLEHDMPTDPLNSAMEIGIVLKKGQ